MVLKKIFVVRRRSPHFGDFGFHFNQFFFLDGGELIVGQVCKVRRVGFR